jgi:biotin operon repressor
VAGIEENGMCFNAEPNFWTDLDDELLRCLGEQDGAITPSELGARLGMSEAAVCTIIAMLAESGRVRISSVERVVSR